jgi:predicted phosphate transport protein (TIGR00153 family)
MGFRRNRVNKVRGLVVEHLGLVEDAVGAMARGIYAHLDGRPWDEVEELTVETHRREAKADDVRRVAERELVRGALLAGTRRSLLDIVEGVDQLANAAEAAMYFLTLQKVALPDLLHPLIREAVETIQGQMADVKGAVIGLLDGDPGTMKRAEEVDRKESRVDELQRRAIVRLFATDLPLAEKILAREFLERLVEFSDRAEDVSDLVVMAVAVRLP